jgi:hypothetical protein
MSVASVGYAPRSCSWPLAQDLYPSLGAGLLRAGACYGAADGFICAARELQRLFAAVQYLVVG